MLKPHRVHSSRILRDQSRASRGVGFARSLFSSGFINCRMTDRESADAVIEQWNGKTYPGADIPLQVRFADTPMQKSRCLIDLDWQNRTKECNRSTPKLACQRVQLVDSGSSIKPVNSKILWGAIWTRDLRLPSCATIRQRRELAAWCIQ